MFRCLVLFSVPLRLWSWQNPKLILVPTTDFPCSFLLQKSCVLTELKELLEQGKNPGFSGCWVHPKAGLFSCSGKECDTRPENEEFFPIKGLDHHRRNREKHHPLSGGFWEFSFTSLRLSKEKKEKIKNSCCGFPSPPPSFVCSLALERKRSYFNYLLPS